MLWFEGTIPEAIADAKQNQKVFLVYIEGNDDLSKAMSQTYCDQEIGNKLNKSACVAIKIEADSASCRQFSQIYPVLVIPSSFFIGVNGIPLEIVAGNVEPKTFMEKLDKVFKLHEESVKNVQNSKVSKLQPNDIDSDATGSHQGVKKKTFDTEQNLDSSVAEKVSNDKPEQSSSFPVSVDVEPVASTSSDNTHESSPMDVTSGLETISTSPTLEERVERAKNLMESVKHKKALEEREKEKADEIKRRKTGKEIQKAKLQKQQQECADWSQERAKEKAEEKLARQRVLAQIAQDRAERAVKYHMQKNEEEQKEKEKKEKFLKAEQEKAALEASRRSKIARIQFRLPNGTFVTHVFSADATLEEARQFVEQEIRPNFSNFNLSTTFPRRQFTSNDYSQSLRDLQLAPSSALLILPVPAGKVLPQGKKNTFSLWFLLSLFVMAWRFVTNFLFGSKSQSSSDQKKSEDGGEKPSTSHAHDGESRDPSNSGRGGFYRREGNIYRLTSQNSDEDENNTWNGNSTQQM